MLAKFKVVITFSVYYYFWLIIYIRCDLTPKTISVDSFGIHYKYQTVEQNRSPDSVLRVSTMRSHALCNKL
jgi:hypothetical protein